MNSYICIGKIINTFGIKGELKILSDFEYKDRVFAKEFNVYIGVNKQKEIVATHREHKGHDLLTFKGYTNINEVLKYKGEKIYILRDDLKLNDREYLLSDLIDLEVYEDEKLLGIVKDYDSSLNYTLLKIEGNKTFYIPLVDRYIKNIDIKMKKIETINGSDLIL